MGARGDPSEPSPLLSRPINRPLHSNSMLQEIACIRFYITERSDSVIIHNLSPAWVR